MIQGSTHAIACLWRSEDNFVASMPSVFVGFKLSAQSVCSECPFPRATSASCNFQLLKLTSGTLSPPWDDRED